MYLYKLNIESEVDGTLQEKTGRLYIQN